MNMKWSLSAMAKFHREKKKLKLFDYFLVSVILNFIFSVNNFRCLSYWILS